MEGCFFGKTPSVVYISLVSDVQPMNHQAPTALHKWTSLPLDLFCSSMLLILWINCRGPWVDVDAWVVPGAGLEVRPCHLDMYCGEGRLTLDAVNVNDGLDGKSHGCVTFEH